MMMGQESEDWAEIYRPRRQPIKDLHDLAQAGFDALEAVKVRRILNSTERSADDAP